MPGRVFEKLQDEMVEMLKGMLINDSLAKKAMKALPDQHDFSNTVTKMINVFFSFF